MNDLKGEKVVVTGGAGFVGSHIVDLLVSEGAEVVVVDNMFAGKKENVNSEAALHMSDIRDTKAMADIFKGATFVFHEAAVPRVPYSIEHPEETHDNNVNGTLSVLSAAKETGVKRVVCASSSSTYGDQDKMPLVETMPPEPVHPYGLQKYVGELYAKLYSDVYGLETVSLRYFNVYGPRLDPEGDYALVIGKFLKQRKEGKPLTIIGDGEQTRDFTHVSDVARANLLAATSGKVGKGEAINIGAGKSISVNKLADMFGGERVTLPARIEARHTLSDTEKAKELLGWEAEVSFEDGVAELKKAFKL
ncbi:MAG: NAD-dependent epimerase/dehydratase family protein [Parcubacteria group bacterium]|nr:NAD-dependent epimerase/dehydratase family protein [Parcubacteria group bacterium]